MQYLLNDEEMAAIRHDRERWNKLPGGSDHLEALKNVCQKVATTMVPATDPAMEGLAPSRRPHGCIHVRDHRGEQYQIHYCNMCPVQGICPQPKNWSQ